MSWLPTTPPSAGSIGPTHFWVVGSQAMVPRVPSARALSRAFRRSVTESSEVPAQHALALVFTLARSKPILSPGLRPS